MFPLALGIVPHERKSAVISKVKERRMNVGMVTVMWLIRALGEADQGPHLIELLTNSDWHGWASCLSRGATATWESWNSDVISGESQSHAWGAAGLEAYARYILGIQPLKPQYEELLIMPLDFGNRLDWAKGTIATDRGPIAVKWRRGTSIYEIRVMLPVNVTARIAMPRGSASKLSVLLDGVETRAAVEGGYLVIEGVGSGEHTIIRAEP
jgi:alpha-L-rhamnosidase